MTAPREPGPVPDPAAEPPAPGCPVAPGHGPEGWDLEAHIEAMRRARQSQAAGRLDAGQAEEMARRSAEQRAERRGVDSINRDFVESLGKKLGYGHPLSERRDLPPCTWSAAAEARLAEVPAFCRELTRWRVEWTAHKLGLGTTITPEIMEIKYEMWGQVSHAIQAREREALPWTESARRRFERVPEFVRGQVLEAVEGNARTMGAAQVDDSVVDSVIERWARSGDFHEGLYGFR
ncbi:MAG: PCP reductase family protein [Candidatus Dormibacteria bacterium]